jgi:DNA-binding response OmpR family regulator
MRILIAEDDGPVASFLKAGLETEQHSVEVAADGREAERRALHEEYDLMILDLGLPLADGWHVLREVRSRKSHLPVLILSGRSRVEDRVKGLDLGADDYMTKPFSFAELSARVRALQRRTWPAAAVLRVGDLEMDRITHRVERAGRALSLSAREYALLEFLVQHAGEPVSRAAILEHVWKHAPQTPSNVVDVYINYLRHKVDGGFACRLIHTARGVGYRVGIER